MTFLNPAQLARVRSQVLRTLPDVGLIQDKTLVSDGAGGNAETWATVAGGTVSCRVDPVSERYAEDLLIASKGAVKVRYLLTVPFDAPILPELRFVTGGFVYRIVSLSADHSDRAVSRAFIERVT